MKNKKIISLAVAFILGVSVMPLMAQSKRTLSYEASYTVQKFPTSLENYEKLTTLEQYKNILAKIDKNINDSLHASLVKTSITRDEERFEKVYSFLINEKAKNDIAISALEELINMTDGADGFNYLFYNLQKRGHIKISSQAKVKFLWEAIILHPSDVDLFRQIFDYLEPKDVTEYFEASILIEQHNNPEDMTFNTTNLLNLLNGKADDLKATVKEKRVPLIAYWAYNYSKIDNPNYLDYVQTLIDFGANLNTEVENGKTVRDYINESHIEAVRNLIK